MNQTLTPYKEFWAELQVGMGGSLRLPKSEYFYLLLVNVHTDRLQLLLLLMVMTVAAILTSETFSA